MLDPIADFLKKKRGRVDEYREKIEMMLNDPENYDWAEEFLTSVYDSLIERETISEKQMAAVDKIEQSIHERPW